MWLLLITAGGLGKSDQKGKVLADFFRSSKWDNMLIDAIRSLSEISSKVNSIKNAADHIQKNTELVQSTFVNGLKAIIERTKPVLFLQEYTIVS